MQSRQGEWAALQPWRWPVSKKVARGSLPSFLCLPPTSRPLSLAAGVKLLEILAEHVHMSSGSFINIRWGWCLAGEAGI